MRHVQVISKRPLLAQSAGVCADTGTDFQSRLCFVIEFFTSFLLPVIQLKSGGTDTTT